jgi:hypothetical protein
MPYIDDEARDRLQIWGGPETAGELNYTIALKINDYIQEKGLSYQTLNDVHGVLTMLDKELYRRISVPYEERKMNLNGEVFNVFKLDEPKPLSHGSPGSLGHGAPLCKYKWPHIQECEPLV